MHRTRDARPPPGPARFPAPAPPARRRCTHRTARGSRSAARPRDTAHPGSRTGPPPPDGRDGTRYRSTPRAAAPGNSSASAFSTATAGGLCSGASGSSASMRASVAASTSAGASRSGPPCTTRWPNPIRPRLRMARPAIPPASPAPPHGPWCVTDPVMHRLAVGGGDQQPTLAADPLHLAALGARRLSVGHADRRRISGWMSRHSERTGDDRPSPLGLSCPERACFAIRATDEPRRQRP